MLYIFYYFLALMTTYREFVDRIYYGCERKKY